jgi:RNA polymerase sigma factor (TIGR02999 family)
MDDSSEITQLLRRWSAEEPAVRSELIVLLYPELRRIAESRMRSERRDHTLQPTALVNEFFLRLARQEKFQWRNRSHFLAVASRTMLNLLVDYARSHNAQANGGNVFKVQLEGLDVAGHDSGVDPVVIGELLGRLASQEPRASKVVELHCFGGLTFPEIAEILNVDEKTAKRDWQMARAWLRGKLRKSYSADAG